MRWTAVALVFVIAGLMGGAADARPRGGATTTSGGGQTVSAITVNFVPQGNYTSGSNAVTGTLYFTGGCTSGTQIGSLVATASGGAYSGSWTTTGTNASDFAITGSNPGALKCNATLAAGSYSFNAVAGTNSFAQAITAYAGQTYYISPTGNDSNFPCTTSGSPCLSPNHSVHCGDFFIMAASASYNGGNFEGGFGGSSAGTWGAVTCPGNDNVAWVKCATFDACKFSGFGPQAAMEISANYWGIQGMEATNSTVACFAFDPPTNSATIHHIAIGDVVANGCQLNGISGEEYAGGTGPTSSDYVAIIGNAVYNGAQGTSECFSGISDGAPANFDTNAGTHRYHAWNLSWHNIDGSTCAGSPGTTDGEGDILDCIYCNNYTGQYTLENNLFVGNGSSGFEGFQEGTQVGVPYIVYRYNTTYGNLTDANHTGTLSWGIDLDAGGAGGYQVLVEHNLAREPTQQTPLGPGTIYALGNGGMTVASIIDLNWLSGFNSSQNIINYNAAAGYSCTAGGGVSGTPEPNSLSCAGNVLTTNPAFVSATIPGAPSCGSATDTINCMQTTWNNFVSTAGGSTAYGAQATAPGDASNTTPFLLNVSRALPADMDKHG